MLRAQRREAVQHLRTAHARTPGGGADVIAPAATAGAYSKSVWGAAVAAASDAVNSRQGSRSGNAVGGRRARKGRRVLDAYCRLVARCRAPWLLRRAFRVGAFVLCASLTAYCVLSWSAREALRFPSPQAVRPVFPLLGACASFEYWIYLGDLMLLAGAAAYTVAYWIESHFENS